MLTVLDNIPEGFLQCDARSLHRVLPGPTLIHLTGKQPQAVFVSILLHGNEDIGLHAIQRILHKYRNLELPRALSIFVGNVQAAATQQRHLPGQTDYNRVWPIPGEPDGHSAEQQMMATVLQLMEQRHVFVSIDLHNNTGLNPHYACVNTLTDATLHLATLFSRTVVYFIRPRGVQSMAFAQLCPAVTLECGRVGDQHGVDHAVEFLDACLHLTHLPAHPVASHDIDLYHTVATIKIPALISFGFDQGQYDLCLNPDIERLNFSELAPGQIFGYTNQAIEHALVVTDEQGRRVTSEYFINQNGNIVLQKPVMPSMLTIDSNVVRQDCLGYLMERYPLEIRGQT